MNKYINNKKSDREIYLTIQLDAIKGNKITTYTKGTLGRGYNVYIHPVSVNITKLHISKRKTYLVRWFSNNSFYLDKPYNNGRLSYCDLTDVI